MIFLKIPYLLDICAKIFTDEEISWVCFKIISDEGKGKRVVQMKQDWIRADGS